MSEQRMPNDPRSASRARFGRRVRASGLHFLLSLFVAAMVSAVVFLVWYPPPFASIAGGFSLFALLISVDVVLGPTLTAIIASPGKRTSELRRDLAVIVIVQIAAFSYGLHTIALARPVYISFEIDRFRVVTAADIEPGSLHDAPGDLQSLSWTGPRLIAAVKPEDPGEQIRSIELGLAGFDLSMVPRNWRDYARQRDHAWHAARSTATLLVHYPNATSDVARIAAHVGQSPNMLRFLPVMSQRASWVALMAAPDARIVGYLPLDGFF